MNGRNQAAIKLLLKVTEAIALVNGPVSSAVAGAAVNACATVLRDRGMPASMQTLDAITALIEALREDITA